MIIAHLSAVAQSFQGPLIVPSLPVPCIQCPPAGHVDSSENGVHLSLTLNHIWVQHAFPRLVSKAASRATQLSLKPCEATREKLGVYFALHSLMALLRDPRARAAW